MTEGITVDAEVAQNAEQIDAIDYLHFEYQGRRFNVKRTPFTPFPKEGDPPPPTDREGANLEIFSDNGTLHGRIYGDFISDPTGQEVEFHAKSIKNLNSKVLKESAEKNSEHIPGIVRETIAQILVQEKISQWVTSHDLLKGGFITYDSLLADPRLKGTKKILPDISTPKYPLYQYNLSKK